MRSLEPPDTRPGRGPGWILLAALLVAGLATWYVATRPASSPASDGREAAAASDTPAAGPSAGVRPPGTPTSGNDGPDATERLGRNGTAGGATTRGAPPRSEASRPAAGPATPAAAARELRVTADVDGAYVFLDRKFLGSTPLVSRDVTAGTHQLNVQTQGRPPVVRTIEIAADGPTEVSVTLASPAVAAAAQLSAAVDVVHQHGMGSCEGTLRATGDGFRYDTPHKDAFSLPFASVEAFTVDYAEKRLRLKQRGGRTWNFTTRAANADPLFVFHRDVEAARTR